jgi:hypothetical protein
MREWLFGGASDQDFQTALPVLNFITATIERQEAAV